MAGSGGAGAVLLGLFLPFNRAMMPAPFTAHFFANYLCGRGPSHQLCRRATRCLEAEVGGTIDLTLGAKLHYFFVALPSQNGTHLASPSAEISYFKV
jgi:hypothetical protein